jgi:two-component system response regulator HydG
LVVEDDRDVASMMQDALRKRGFDVELACSASECLAMLSANSISIDVVVTDVRMTGMSGIELCQALSERYPGLPTIVVTGFSDLETAIGALRASAYDFIVKPVKPDVLALAVTRAHEHVALKRELSQLRSSLTRVAPLDGIAGTSAPITELVTMIQRVGPSDATVLISGESGTGKELVAKALHRQSPRCAEPFVAINCAAMSAELLESELFGHVRGAFTDAKHARAGLFAQAGGGTIFLDEIGEMPMEMQVKLLRVLQERTVRPVGGDDEIPIAARVIAATNRDLEVEVAEKRFREDLFYRINVVAIVVPPLRARPGDILLLAQYMLERYAKEIGKAVRGISSTAARMLVDYDWPGNVRELENSMQRAVALCRLDSLTVDDLPERVQMHHVAKLGTGAAVPLELVTIREMERTYVQAVMQATRGNKTHAARVLGIDRRSLYRRLEQPKEVSVDSSTARSAGS